MLLGSAPVGPTTVERLQKYTGKLPVVRFGSTETCLQVSGPNLRCQLSLDRVHCIYNTVISSVSNDRCRSVELRSRLPKSNAWRASSEGGQMNTMARLRMVTTSVNITRETLRYLFSSPLQLWTLDFVFNRIIVAPHDRVALRSPI